MNSTRSAWPAFMSDWRIAVSSWFPTDRPSSAALAEELEPLPLATLDHLEELQRLRL